MTSTQWQDTDDREYHTSVGVEPMVNIDPDEPDHQFVVTDHDGTPLRVIAQGGRNIGKHYHIAARPDVGDSGGATLFDPAPPPKPRCSAPLYDEESHNWKYKRPEHVVFRDLCHWCGEGRGYQSNASNATADREADHAQEVADD